MKCLNKFNYTFILCGKPIKVKLIKLNMLARNT